MPLTFSPEQVAFREAVRSFLADKSPEDEVRRLMATDTGYDPAVWAQLNEQLGAAGLAVPEEYGGSGYTFRELAIVLEEAGRRLLRPAVPRLSPPGAPGSHSVGVPRPCEQRVDDFGRRCRERRLRAWASATSQPEASNCSDDPGIMAKLGAGKSSIRR